MEGRKEGRRLRTAGEQADVEQRLVAELRGVVAERGFGTPKSHAFVPEPADQPEQFTMTLEGVTAEVTGQERRAVNTNTQHHSAR